MIQRRRRKWWLGVGVVIAVLYCGRRITAGGDTFSVKQLRKAADAAADLAEELELPVNLIMVDEWENCVQIDLNQNIEIPDEWEKQVIDNPIYQVSYSDWQISNVADKDEGDGR